MNVYFDASILLRILLGDGPLLEGWSTFARPFTSRLTLVEARRVIDRNRLTAVLNGDDLSRLLSMLLNIEQGLHVLPIVEEVLERASRPMPTTVRTLDAIHLASAMVIRDEILPDLIFATHDRQQATGARAIGFEVIGVTW
jgi:uncharacterized protein